MTTAATPCRARRVPTTFCSHRVSFFVPRRTARDTSGGAGTVLAFEVSRAAGAGTWTKLARTWNFPPLLPEPQPDVVFGKRRGGCRRLADVSKLPQLHLAGDG